MAKRSAALIFSVLAALLLAGCAAGKPANPNARAGASGSNTLTGAAKQTAGGDAAHGRTVYIQNCASCHGVTAAGGVGPSLKNEKSRKDFAQAVAWIKNPQPPMPKLFPSPLSEKDVRDVAAYVESL